MNRLDGRCALITGAARGIGLAFAQAYVAEGARVAIADIDIDRATRAMFEFDSEACRPLLFADTVSPDEIAK